MFTKLSRRAEVVYLWLKKVISSKYFFWGVVVLAVLQGLWYAIIFQPVIYDEGHHVLATFFYVSHTNPFNIGIQQVEWDVLGEMSRNVSYVFYYLMSIPLRIFEQFTSEYMIQVIGLRVIMIALFASGLIFYRKTFKLIGFSSFSINLALLLVILLPNIAPFPGVVSYDNLIFLLFSVCLFLAVKMVKAKKLEAITLLSFIAIIIFSLLIKFSTALALTLPILAYVLYDASKKYGRNYIKMIRSSLRKSSQLVLIALVAVIIIGVGLLIERPIKNYILFQRVSPSCEHILSKERCLKNYTYKRGVIFREIKASTWRSLDPFEYLSTYWLNNMIKTSTRVPAQTSLPVVNLLYYFMAIIGTVLILINLKKLLEDKMVKMVIIGFIFFITMLFYENYRAYVSLGQPVAMDGRYLLPYLPVFGVLAIASASRIFSGYVKRWAIFAVPVLIFLLILQGGGVVTAIMTQNTYWTENTFSRNVNEKLKITLQPLIKETPLFK